MTSTAMASRMSSHLKRHAPAPRSNSGLGMEEWQNVRRLKSPDPIRWLVRWMTRVMLERSVTGRNLVCRELVLANSLSAIAMRLPSFHVWGRARTGFPNFGKKLMVFKRYNPSDLYALFVGYLADRILGGGAFVSDWSNIRQLPTG